MATESIQSTESTGAILSSLKPVVDVEKKEKGTTLLLDEKSPITSKHLAELQAQFDLMTKQLISSIKLILLKATPSTTTSSEETSITETETLAYIRRTKDIPAKYAEIQRPLKVRYLQEVFDIAEQINQAQNEEELEEIAALLSVTYQRLEKEISPDEPDPDWESIKNQLTVLRDITNEKIFPLIRQKTEEAKSDTYLGNILKHRRALLQCFRNQTSDEKEEKEKKKESDETEQKSAFSHLPKKQSDVINRTGRQIGIYVTREGKDNWENVQKSLTPTGICSDPQLAAAVMQKQGRLPLDQKTAHLSQECIVIADNIFDWCKDEDKRLYTVARTAIPNLRVGKNSASSIDFQKFVKPAPPTTASSKNEYTLIADAFRNQCELQVRLWCAAVQGYGEKHRRLAISHTELNYYLDKLPDAVRNQALHIWYAIFDKIGRESNIHIDCYMELRGEQHYNYVKNLKGQYKTAHAESRINFIGMDLFAAMRTMNLEKTVFLNISHPQAEHRRFEDGFSIIETMSVLNPQLVQQSQNPQMIDTSKPLSPTKRKEEKEVPVSTSAPDEFEIVEPKIHIQLREDQYASDVKAFRSQAEQPEIIVLMPKWAPLLLAKLSHHLLGYTCIIKDKSQTEVEKLLIDGVLSPILLQMIARNEAANVTGDVNWALFENFDLTETQRRQIVMSIKDLARCCVSVVDNHAHFYGGYGMPWKRYPKPMHIGLIDQIALSLQKNDNTGRLIMIGGDIPEGLFDNELYQLVVGEKRKTLQEVVNMNPQERDKRYVRIPAGSSKLHKTDFYIDIKAYTKFISSDFVLILQAAKRYSQSFSLLEGYNLLLESRFLSIGTGFFVTDDKIRGVLQQNILDGMLSALEIFAAQEEATGKKISEYIPYVTFPFHRYKPTTAQNARLEKLKKDHDVAFNFTETDTFAPPIKPECTPITLTCSDEKSVFGNNLAQEPFGSIDETEGTNSKRLGNHVSCVFNPNTRFEFVDTYMPERKSTPKEEKKQAVFGQKEEKKATAPLSIEKLNLSVVDLEKQILAINEKLPKTPVTIDPQLKEKDTKEQSSSEQAIQELLAEIPKQIEKLKAIIDPKELNSVYENLYDLHRRLVSLKNESTEQIMTLTTGIASNELINKQKICGLRLQQCNQWIKMVDIHSLYLIRQMSDEARETLYGGSRENRALSLMQGLKNRRVGEPFDAHLPRKQQVENAQIRRRGIQVYVTPDENKRLRASEVDMLENGYIKDIENEVPDPTLMQDLYEAKILSRANPDTAAYSKNRITMLPVKRRLEEKDTKDHHARHVMLTCAINLGITIHGQPLSPADWKTCVKTDKNGKKTGLNKAAIEKACLDQARFICGAAKNSGMKYIATSAFGMGTYLSGLSEKEEGSFIKSKSEKATVMDIKYKAFIQAAKEYGIHINWYIFSGASNADATVAGLEKAYPETDNPYVHFAKGDLLQKMREISEVDTQSTCFLIPSNDQSLGDQWTSPITPILETQFVHEWSVVENTATGHPDMRQEMHRRIVIDPSQSPSPAEIKKSNADIERELYLSPYGGHQSALARYNKNKELPFQDLPPQIQASINRQQENIQIYKLDLKGSRHYMVAHTTEWTRPHNGREYAFLGEAMTDDLDWQPFFSEKEPRQFYAEKFKQHCITEARSLCVIVRQLCKNKLLVPDLEPSDLQGLEKCPEAIAEMRRIRYQAFAEAAKTAGVEVVYHVWPGGTKTDKKKAEQIISALEADRSKEIDYSRIQLIAADIAKTPSQLPAIELENTAIFVGSSARVHQEFRRQFTWRENTDPILNPYKAEKLNNPQTIAWEKTAAPGKEQNSKVRKSSMADITKAGITSNFGDKPETKKEEVLKEVEKHTGSSQPIEIEELVIF